MRAQSQTFQSKSPAPRLEAKVSRARNKNKRARRAGLPPCVEGVELDCHHAAVAADEKIDAIRHEMWLYAMFDAFVVLHKFFANGFLIARKFFKITDAEILRDSGQIAVAHEASELPLRTLYQVIIPPESSSCYRNTRIMQDTRQSTSAAQCSWKTCPRLQLAQPQGRLKS